MNQQNELKKSNAPSSTITRDVIDLAVPVGNVYELVTILSKRANQISANLKEELSGKLEEFASSNDNLEEIFENREQIEISKHYERMPKPTNLAVEEWIEDRVYFRDPEAENQ